MRHLLLLALPVVSAGILFACSDDGPGNPIVTTDAGDVDAGSPLDAAPVDTDGGNDAGAPVSVLVLRGGLPRADVRVVFHDAQGAVLETKLTGADGRATSGTAAVPSMATALLGGGEQLELLTWTSLEAGDELVAVDEDPSPALLGTLDVTLPGNVAGGPTYQALLGACQANGPAAATPLTISVVPECKSAAPAVLGRAVDDSVDAVLKYATAKPSAFPPSDGGSAAVTLGAWTDPVTVTMNATNLPTGTVTAQYADITGGLLFKHPAARDVVSGAVTFEAAPAGFADAVQPLITVDLDEPLGARKTMSRRAPPGTAFAFDFASALPTVTAATVSAADPFRPEIAWTSSAALTSADGGVVRVAFTDDRVPTIAWSFVVAAGATSVKAPALPAEAADWTPRGGDGGAPSNFDLPEVAFVEAEALPSYAAFRKAAGVVLPAAAVGRDISLALPQDGAVRTTFYQFNDGN